MRNEHPSEHSFIFQPYFDHLAPHLPPNRELSKREVVKEADRLDLPENVKTVVHTVCYRSVENVNGRIRVT